MYRLCGACIPVCPTTSIFNLEELPAELQEFVQKKAAYFNETSRPKLTARPVAVSFPFWSAAARRRFYAMTLPNDPMESVRKVRSREGTTSPAEESQFVVIPSQARDLLFAECHGKRRFLTPQIPFGMTKGESFRSLFSRAICAYPATRL
jgi:ferredoxin